MRLARVASASLIALALSAAEPVAPAQPPQREYTTQPTLTVSMGNAGEVKRIAKVALFVTEDGGNSWRKAQELPVAPEAAQLPTFTFTAAGDGAYGLWTCATSRDGMTETEPAAGVTPKKILVVDRAAPALERLEATLGGVADGQATLALSWKVADPNLGKDPVSLEVSTDQGKSFAARTGGAAEGTTGIAVPVAAVAEIQVRVIARDLAGNVLTSPAKAVALPTQARPSDPAEALAAAVAALPRPDELGIAARAGSPIVSTGESPLAGAAPEKPPVGGKSPAVAAPGAEVPVVAGQDVEGRFARESNPGNGAATRSGRQTTPDAVGDGPVAAPSDRAITADPQAPFLTGGEAAAALAQARNLERDADVDGALALYLRLHRSTVAKDAVAAELALLRTVGDHRTIRGIVEVLPPELRTDTARLGAARAAAATGDHTAAAAWAAKVRSSAPEAREALLVLARAMKGLGRASEARRLFDQLTSGDDEFAAQARAER